MISLRDVMAVKPVHPVLVRPQGQPERGFRLGAMMDKVNRRSSKASLLVTFDATHSGTIVNARCYPGLQMRDSIQSWLNPFPKPILEQHPDKNPPPGAKEPIVYGRARDVEFVQLVNDAQLAQDWKTPTKKDRGSGFIKLRAGIEDKNAIEQIMDGRFLTVSAGMDTDHMFCSVCGSDWALRDGRCSHVPNQSYKLGDGDFDAIMYLITGKLYYDHLARVNSPAQPYATVLEHVEADQIFNSKDIETMFSNGELIDGAVSKLVLIDSQDGPMELVLQDTALQDPTSSWQDKDWAEAYVLTGLADAGRLKDEAIEEALPRIQAFRTSDRRAKIGQPRFRIGPDGCLRITDRLTADAAADLVKRGSVKCPDPKHLGSRISECADLMNPVNVGGDSHMTNDPSKQWEEVVKLAEGLDSKMNPNAACDWSDFVGDLFDLATEEGVAEQVGYHAGIIVADKVLSSKARKALPDSSFCGPNRSFPAHDAAHVRNALARLPQSTNFTSEQKAKILSCVRSRAKTLGVEVNQDSLKYDTLIHLLDKSATLPEVPPTETDTQKLSRLEKQLAAASTKIGDQEASITKLLTDNTALRSETNKMLAARVMDLRAQLKKPDVVLLDTEAKRQEYLAKLNLRTTVSLQDACQDLLVEVTSAGAKPPEGVADPTDPKHDNAGKGAGKEAKAGEMPKKPNPAAKLEERLKGSK